LHNFYPKENVLTEKLAVSKDAEPELHLVSIPEIVAPKTEDSQPRESIVATADRKSATVRYGIMNVRGPTGSKVEIARAIVGDVPASFKLPAGVYKVVVILPGGFREPQFIHLAANSEVTVEPPPNLKQPQQ